MRWIPSVRYRSEKRIMKSHDGASTGRNVAHGHRGRNIGVLVVGIGLVLVGAWFAYVRWQTSGDSLPPTTPPAPGTGLAEAAPRAAPPIQPIREAAAPASQPAETPPTATSEAPVPPLAPDKLRQIERIRRLVPGVEPALSEVQELARRDETRFKELAGIVEEAATSIGRLRDEAYRMQDEIVAVRLREGRYETISTKGRPPLPNMEGEVVQCMIVYDPARGESVRKLFRILPGESPDFDLVHARMRNEASGLLRVVKDFLAATR